MLKSIFLYKNYLEYLQAWIAAQPKKGRGMRLRLSHELQCHSAYITFVMSGRAHLSLEQGVRLCKFIDLMDDESHYFMLLLQSARSGTQDLKKYFDQQLEAVLKKRNSVKDRIANHETLSTEHQLTYYSSWHYAAIHMAVSARTLQTPLLLAQYFGLTTLRVRKVLAFLVSIGLVKKTAERYELGTGVLHLGHDSPIITKHHTNWRIEAINSLDRGHGLDLHYSSATMISEAAAEEIRIRLLEAVDDVRKSVKAAPEEHCYAYLIDLFKVSAANI